MKNQKISPPPRQESTPPPQNRYDYKNAAEGGITMARVDRDRHYISWKGMALASLLLTALFCVSLYWVKADIARLQAQDATLQLKVNVMEMNYADLQLELQRVGSEGYVENEARENYGFIRSGEIVFAFENPELLRGYTEEEYQIIMDEMRD